MKRSLLSEVRPYWAGRDRFTHGDAFSERAIDSEKVRASCRGQHRGIALSLQRLPPLWAWQERDFLKPKELKFSPILTSTHIRI